MKRSIKLIALFLALVMCCSALFACNTTEEESTEAPNNQNESGSGSGSESETEEAAGGFEFIPDIAETDYGKDFILSIMGDSNSTKYHWVEESAGDALSESIYARQEAVFKHLGVEVVGKQHTGDHTSYTTEYQTAVKNKDDSLHMMITHVHSGVGNLVTGNYLRNLLTVDGLNVEDADYWSHKMMEDLDIAGKQFLGNNKFNILYTHVIVFNKTMMEQYEDAFGTTMYELVDNYQWTLDKMIEFSEQVYIDATSDGKTEDDTYGITGTQWISFIGFLHASGMQLIDTNEKGDYGMAFYSDTTKEKVTDLIDKLKAMTTGNSGWFKYRIEPTPTIGLDTGRALMEIRSTNGLESLTQAEDLKFGVLPYPMYDEAQKDVGYRHLQWGGYTIMPSYVADPKMVAETIEMLAYYSYDVNVSFYEKLLGKQAADAPDDRRMLEIVWNTICGDIGQSYSDIASILYMVPELSAYSSTRSVQSYYDSSAKRVDKTFQKFVKQVAALKDQ